MKISGLKRPISNRVTKCPHCGADAFVGLRFSSEDSAMSVIDMRHPSDIRAGDISLGGPGLIVYFKRCRNCGFIAPFDAKIVDENGIL